MEKEDVLTCVIFTLVHHKLDGLGLAIEWLKMALGDDMFETMRGLKVDSYLADLVAAYEFLT